MIHNIVSLQETLCRRSNKLLKHPQTFSKRKTNATKCHLELLCKAEDFHWECCSIVPVIALKPFQMPCSLFSNRSILMLTKVNCCSPLAVCYLQVWQYLIHQQTLNLSMHPQINDVLSFSVLVKFQHKTALPSKSWMQFMLCFLKKINQKSFEQGIDAIVILKQD